jgi:Flp pilus assembly pilin Flp
VCSQEPDRRREEVTNMSFAKSLDLFRSVRTRQEGQTMAEYAVVLGVIAIAVVVALTALSGGISNALSNVTGLI